LTIFYDAIQQVMALQQKETVEVVVGVSTHFGGQKMAYGMSEMIG
jgi:hypothetical protein